MHKTIMSLLLLTATCQATANAQQDAKQTTEQRLEQLEKQLATLEAKDASDDKLVTLGGRLQIDANIFDGVYNADNQGHTGSTIFPRRARLSADGERDELEYKLILEFAEETIEILLLRFEYNGFENGPTIKFGKIREDIAMDALTSSKHMALIERSSVANTMSPYSRRGVAANQYFESTGLRYAVGAYKNDAFGAEGTDEDSALSLAYTGRVTWSQQLTNDTRVHVGSWVSHRKMDESTLAPAFARAEVRETNVRLVNYAAGGDAAAVDSLTQYGVEAAYQYNNLILQSEYAQRTINTTDPTSLLDGERYNGYYLLASYMLTGETKHYSTGSARFSVYTPRTEVQK